MKSLATTLDIDAPVAHVWATLTDFARLPEWGQFVKSIVGERRVGARLEVRLDDGKRPMTIRPELLAFTENEELCWRGVLGAGFIFAGEHHFRLTSLPGGRTRLTHGETFGGLLVPLLWKTLDTRTRAAFMSFNEALRARAEATAAAA